MLEDKLLNSLSTGIILIKLDSKVLVDDLNLAAIEILGLDKKAINTGDLRSSHPNLASLVQDIKDENIKTKEIFANGNYLKCHVSKINDSELIIEIHKIVQKDIGKTTHELKRPIQNIKTLTEALLMGAKDDPAQSEKFLENINYEADRLGRLVNDLLRISSLQSGNVEIKKEKVKVKEVSEKILNSLDSLIKEMKVSVENNLENSLEINVDKDLFIHAFENLIENAVKYNKENGTVKLENNKNEITISDTGLGIEKKDQEKIFEQFYRSNKTEKIPGTGLGLSIVKSIVELHGGNLSVKSESGIGSSFKISLS